MSEGSPKLDALRMLLSTAQELSRVLSDDPLVGRLLRAMMSLQPDDRETLTLAIERGAAWRRTNEAVAGATGVRLRANPKPVLFVRVVDPPPPEGQVLPDKDDVVIGVLRLMRLARMMRSEPAKDLWRPAVAEALAMLEPAQRAECVAFVEELLAVLGSAVDDEPTPSSS
jgi:hypothetical protein